MSLVPFRLDEKYGQPRAKIQFITFAAMPNLIYQACVASGVQSNTVYIQHAVCEKLARDLGLDLDELLGKLPNPVGNAKRLHPGPGNTVEEVK